MHERQNFTSPESAVFSFLLDRALSVHSDHCRAMKCRIRGRGHPGKNGRLPGENHTYLARAIHPCTREPVRIHQLVVLTNFRRETRGPHTRWTTSTSPDYRRYRGMGDECWRGQKEELVEYCLKYLSLMLNLFLRAFIS